MWIKEIEIVFWIVCKWIFQVWRYTNRISGTGRHSTETAIRFVAELQASSFKVKFKIQQRLGARDYY